MAPKGESPRQILFQKAADDFVILLVYQEVKFRTKNALSSCQNMGLKIIKEQD